MLVAGCWWLARGVVLRGFLFSGVKKFINCHPSGASRQQSGRQDDIILKSAWMLDAGGWHVVSFCRDFCLVGLKRS